MTVGVIGVGRVGRAAADLFNPHHDLVLWDADWEEPYPAAELAACEFVIVSVGTPAAEGGGVDVSAVERAVAQVPCARVLLKSTVPPGTVDRLEAITGKEICFWPEYIGESAYHNPFFPSKIDQVPFVVLGGRPALRRWFIDRLLPTLGPTKVYFQCSAVEAELIKHAENAYFATKITFVNELRGICEALEVDWHTVREGWLLDPRIERMHTAAFEHQRGFAGKCLPKDLSALIAAAEERGYEAALLGQVAASNATFQALNADAAQA